MTPLQSTMPFVPVSLSSVRKCATTVFRAEYSEIRRILPSWLGTGMMLILGHVLHTSRMLGMNTASEAWVKIFFFIKDEILKHQLGESGRLPDSGASDHF